MLKEVLRNAPGKNILGIFGIAHMTPILKSWDLDVHTDDLLTETEGIQKSVQLWDKVYGEEADPS